MTDRVVQSVRQLQLPETFLDEVARYFGGDLSVAKCFLNSYNYYLQCAPALAPEEDVLDYLESHLPSNSPY